MIIRKEEKNDFTETAEVVRRAFAQAEHRDGSEHILVTNLRKSTAYIPALSLVAQEDERIIGHILFTKVYIGGGAGLALAPLSVLPAHQNKGVGKALMAEGHRIAAQMGYRVSVVLGSADYYPKAGYIPAVQYGICAPFDVPDENFMVFPLQGDAQCPKGTVEYAKEFFQA